MFSAKNGLYALDFCGSQQVVALNQRCAHCNCNEILLTQHKNKPEYFLLHCDVCERGLIFGPGQSVWHRSEFKIENGEMHGFGDNAEDPDD